MTYLQYRRSLAFSLVALFLLAAPVFAAKRRSVRSPSSGTLIISGKVFDNVTGAPVNNVKVSAGNRSDTTDETGAYEIRNVHLSGSVNIVAERSGYHSKTVSVSLGGTRTIDFRLDPTPTVRLKKIDNSVIELDTESLVFGYTVVFSGFYEDEAEDFCKPDGTSVSIHRSQIKRIVGPATSVTHAPCCANSPTVKVSVELKTGEVSDMYFVDACNGYPNIEIKARNHVTGEMIYIRFSEIAEVVFP